MKKALLIIIVLICIAIIAVAAVFFIRQHHASSDTSEPETSDGSGSDPASTAAKEALEEMIEGLPAPASIDRQTPPKQVKFMKKYRRYMSLSKNIPST